MHQHSRTPISQDCHRTGPRSVRLTIGTNLLRSCGWPWLTWPAGTCPGHQAIAGTLIPPSNVVCFPQRRGPLLPPGEKVTPIRPLAPSPAGHGHGTLSSTARAGSRPAMWRPTWRQDQAKEVLSKHGVGRPRTAPTGQLPKVLCCRCAERAAASRPAVSKLPLQAELENTAMAESAGLGGLCSAAGARA